MDLWHLHACHCGVGLCSHALAGRAERGRDRAAQLPGWNPGAAVWFRRMGLEPAASAGSYPRGGQASAGDLYVSSVDRRDGRWLLLWPRVPDGTGCAPTDHAQAWPGIDDCFYRAAGAEPLWRPGAVGAPEVS